MSRLRWFEGRSEKPTRADFLMCIPILFSARRMLYGSRQTDSRRSPEALSAISVQEDILKILDAWIADQDGQEREIDAQHPFQFDRTQGTFRAYVYPGHNNSSVEYSLGTEGKQAMAQARQEFSADLVRLVAPGTIPLSVSCDQAATLHIRREVLNQRGGIAPLERSAAEEQLMQILGQIAKSFHTELSAVYIQEWAENGLEWQASRSYVPQRTTNDYQFSHGWQSLHIPLSILGKDIGFAVYLSREEQLSGYSWFLTYEHASQLHRIPVDQFIRKNDPIDRLFAAFRAGDEDLMY